MEIQTTTRVSILVCRREIVVEEIPGTTNITQKALRSIKWSALMEIVSRTASPIVAVILARLLTPTDFGVVATATIAISFSQMFWDAGLSKALIQTKEAPEEAAHMVFWTNLILGLVIYTLLFLAAPWLAEFFNSPASASVLKVLGIQIIIASLSSVQQALFVRDLDFHRLFWVKLLTAFFPGVFSIPMALGGYGVWALVAGTLAGQTLNLILLWHYSHWRPKFQFNLHLARKMFGFGIWVLAESFGFWLISWGDNLMVGRFLGVRDLGVYQIGWMLASISFGLMLNPFLSVIFPTFSRLQNNLPALIENFHKINRIITALTLPMGVGFLLVGPEIASVLFGGKWQGLGLVLSTIGLMFGLSWLVGINSDLYRALGRPDVNVKLLIISLLFYLPAYYIGAQFGLETFLYVRLGVAIITLPIHIFLCKRMLNVSPLYLWHDGRNFFYAAIAMGIGLGITKWVIYSTVNPLNQVLVLVLLISSGVSIYTAILWLLDRSFFSQISRIIRQKIL
jgi:O-antigen/teichoic acid export membrane protein